jgi:hypothetical protein
MGLLGQDTVMTVTLPFSLSNKKKNNNYDDNVNKRASATKTLKMSSSFTSDGVNIGGGGGGGGDGGSVSGGGGVDILFSFGDTQCAGGDRQSNCNDSGMHSVGAIWQRRKSRKESKGKLFDSKGDGTMPPPPPSLDYFTNATNANGSGGGSVDVLPAWLAPIPPLDENTWLSALFYIE